MRFGSRIYAIFGFLAVSAVASASLVAGSASAAPIQCFVHVAATIHPRCDGGGDGEPGDGDPTGGDPTGGDPTGGAPTGPPEGPPEGGDPTDPGSDDPGSSEPGTDEEPGSTDPGSTDPGSTDPDPTPPGPQPAPSPPPGPGTTGPTGGNPSGGGPAAPGPGGPDVTNPGPGGVEPVGDLLQPGASRSLFGSVTDYHDQARYEAAVKKLAQLKAQIAQQKAKVGKTQNECDRYAQIIEENNAGRGDQDKANSAAASLSVCITNKLDALQALKDLEDKAKSLSVPKKPVPVPKVLPVPNKPGPNKPKVVPTKP